MVLAGTVGTSPGPLVSLRSHNRGQAQSCPCPQAWPSHLVTSEHSVGGAMAPEQKGSHWLEHLLGMRESWVESHSQAAVKASPTDMGPLKSGGEAGPAGQPPLSFMVGARGEVAERAVMVLSDLLWTTQNPEPGLERSRSS